ncbi:MAG: C25 family cysteine peptidase, partial [Candidatus Thorarchaeota archaeon]
MRTDLFSKLLCLAVISLLLVPPLTVPFSSYFPSGNSTAGMNEQFTALDESLASSSVTDRALPLGAEGPSSTDDDWYRLDENNNWFDCRDMLVSYKQSAESIQRWQTSLYEETSSGMDIRYEVAGSTLNVDVSIGSYSTITYSFEEGIFRSLVVPNTELSQDHGCPVLPYRNIMLSIPDYANVKSIEVRDQLFEPINGLRIIPGPEPLEVSTQPEPLKGLFLDPDAYSSAKFAPNIIETDIVNMGDKQGLYLTLRPLQYNPTTKEGLLAIQMTVEIQFDAPLSPEDFINPSDSFGPSYDNGGGYVLIADNTFVTALADFVDWKTDIGFDVTIETVQDIYLGYPGDDHAEQVRNFINTTYHSSGTEYYLMVGDCDIVPTREVWDPANAGGGLDNGTEPSDFYFECLDGDWDANDNGLYGELTDGVDLFPEVMVGRLPVQTPAQVQQVCASIIRFESNPLPGDWMDDFLLIAPNTFNSGDAANMVEEEINQKFLYDSFFDVDRLYPTDGSLSHQATIDRINAGVSLVDFFDHGAYDQWVGSLYASEALALSNGNMSFLAFAMACETAAFDVESVEPTISEAFFRATNGGAIGYIGATRIAWAGYHAFDGFHHRFWNNFLQDALDQQIANPKKAFQSALYEVVTTFDMANAISLETVYQSIYFGDPTLNFYWKHNVTTEASAVETEEEVQLDGTCNLFNNNTPIVGTVNVTVKDPFGTTLYDDALATNVLGEYTTTFYANEYPGRYTVETTVHNPFEHTTLTDFHVGHLNVTVGLDSVPIYNALLDFSGTSDQDGSGTAYLVDAQGSVIQTKAFTITSGTFSSDINVTDFGMLSLYIEADNSTHHGGDRFLFQVKRGDVLVIADDTGAGSVQYPGGWVDDNAGDSTNYADFYVALHDEYNVSIYYPRWNSTPSLSLLESYNIVVVSVGDNYGYPLVAPSSYLLDVLLEYHNNGGNLLFEGCSILNSLDSAHGAIFPSLFHVGFDQHVINSGSLNLETAAHPITSGLPATIPLAGGLGSPYADVFLPNNGSMHVGGYSGSFTGDSAISALSPSVMYGGVIFIGFSIDAIDNQEYRSQLIKNSAAFLLYPTLMATLSDDALRTGTSETITIDVTECATGTPVPNVLVTFDGCGISASNITSVDGNCTIFINPSTEGIIEVNVTKSGFLNYTTSIIVYDTPIVDVDTVPIYLMKEETQVLTVFTSDYYEGGPLETCLVNLAGCGVADSGYTNSSGLIDFVLTPTSAGLISIEGNLTGHVNFTGYVPVRLTVAVLYSFGTDEPDYCCWDEINFNWQSYGTIPIFIDYTTFSAPDFTLQSLEDFNADVLILSLVSGAYTTAQNEAIMDYVRQGHGLLSTSSSMPENAEDLASLYGVSDSITYTTGSISDFDILNLAHPIFQGMSTPYGMGYGGLSFYPESSGWDPSVLSGASYQALDVSGQDYGAILTHRGLVYCSHIPEYSSSTADIQFIYNSLQWSDYEVPEHELGVVVAAPGHLNPGDSTLLNATVMNYGLNNETDVMLQLFIDGVEADSLFVPNLNNGTSQTLSYSWTPSVEDVYNVTAYAAPVPDEASITNNVATSMVVVFEIAITGSVALFQDQNPWGYTSIEDILTAWGISYDVFTSSSIGSVDLSPYEKVVIASEQPSGFMESVYSNLGWFEGYASQGGILEVHAATNSYWVNGMIPGGPTYIHSAMDAVSIINPVHPVLFNPNLITDEELDGWNSAVHGYLTDIPSGADVILAAVPNYPALIEFSFGAGAIIVSTQTLEWAYGHDYSYILENILLHIPASYDHDLAAGLQASESISPGASTLLNATAFNAGTSIETNVLLQLFIDDIEVDSLFISEFTNGTSQTLSYLWTPAVEGTYNVTAYVAPKPDDESIGNNAATRLVSVLELHDYTMEETSATWLDAKTNGENLFLSGDDVTTSVALSFDFAFYDASFDMVYVSSNGWLSFSNPNPYQYSNPPFPSADSNFAYALAPFWDDLQANSNVYAWVTADWAVIQFDNYEYLGGTFLGTFEIVLYANGVIQFNYLEIVTVFTATVGLNHGDGIHYNDYLDDHLTGVTDFALRFTYQVYEHDLAVTLNVPSELPVDTMFIIDATVTNWGTSDEYAIAFALYIDDALVSSVTIPGLDSGEFYVLSHPWTPTEMGTYNITAYAEPVLGESFTGNNIATALPSVGGTFFFIVEPTTGSTASGGQVYVEFEASDPG